MYCFYLYLYIQKNHRIKFSTCKNDIKLEGKNFFYERIKMSLYMVNVIFCGIILIKK